jgi:hypothetical protein
MSKDGRQNDDTSKAPGNVDGETASGIRPGGRQAELFNDQIFRELRAFAQVPDDFVNAGWNMDALQDGGGKGGTLMARIGSTYIVKEMSKGDHATLLDITNSYGHHVREGETLLSPIYLHFRDVLSGRYFFAMRNAVGDGPFTKLYDLKGCADDKLLQRDGKSIRAVHKRIWKVSMWCGTSAWSDERQTYYKGKLEARDVKIEMTLEQKAKFVECLRRDTEWLAQHQLMDYSLLLAMKEGPSACPSGGSGPSTLGQRPLLRKGPDGTDIALFVSIIDFLQRWSTGKKVAQMIKVMERNKATVPPSFYAMRFRRHFEEQSVTVTSVDGPGESAAVPTAAALMVPAAGDCDAEGKPEERLTSRPYPQSNTSI